MSILDKSYVDFLSHLKEQILAARFRAASAVNQEAISLYWSIGKQILEKQVQANWGSKLIEQVSHDLQNAFPETHGYSVANLKRMRLFAQAYPDLEIGAQPVRQLPWGHIVVLLQKLKDTTERDWYVQKAIEEGWSRLTLQEKIKQTLYQRQGLAENKASNFLERLPSPQSALAHEILKNPYNFDFLMIADDAHEREIERELTKHITKFLLELGKGFAFVGTQVPLVVNEHEFFIDMLFYHLHLRSYIVIELKAKEFKPADAGQLNFYLTAIDRQMKHKDDNPSIGILLCRSRDKVLAEYALQDINKPIGISEYELTKAIPENLKTNLPTTQEIEDELSTDDN